MVIIIACDVERMSLSDSRDGSFVGIGVDKMPLRRRELG
jgi:hypothetical protein